jgi:cell shape-determining protein MreC
LQTQLDEARRQLDNAEREKLFVADKTESAKQPPKAIDEGPQRRRISSQPGLHGTVLAVNQAYNFVVLNLGGRQGVETNAEMLVVRGGTLIGKIRVSSVEPATAIGDIISSTLPRGVQVQPGDIVIYAGTGS